MLRATSSYSEGKVGASTMNKGTILKQKNCHYIAGRERKQMRGHSFYCVKKKELKYLTGTKGASYKN